MAGSIIDFASLQVAVANWMTRAGNADLIANIPDFILFAESRINFGCEDTQWPSPPLRVQQMEVTSFTLVLPNSTNTAVLPADFLELRRLYFYQAGLSRKNKLTYATPNQLDSAYGSFPTGPQAFFTIAGGAILLANNVNTTTTLIGGYFQKIPPLSTSNTVNWLVQQHPGMYLAGACLEASIFVGDDDAAAKWGRMFMGHMRGFQKQDLKGKYSGDVMQMKTDVGNP
jgi:hypothetical protein